MFFYDSEATQVEFWSNCLNHIAQRETSAPRHSQSFASSSNAIFA
jgi:hypothetical protein